VKVVRAAKACATSAALCNVPAFLLSISSQQYYITAKNIAAMAGQVLMAPSSPPSILKLPNELLCDIVSPLSTSDLRRLSRVNHQFYFFVRAYLVKYRYNEGIVTLPNEIILEIVRHLGTQKNRSRLARTSQRFYPLVMNYIVRHDIQFRGSSLLAITARSNLKGMAKKILRLGGNVNTQSCFKSTCAGQRPTPLAAAAFYGHERIICLLLAAGAKQIVDGS